jgi:hypothetical protein
LLKQAKCKVEIDRAIAPVTLVRAPVSVSFDASFLGWDPNGLGTSRF